MQFLTAEYDIEYAVFRELLRATEGTVTGSAALAAYLKQEGQDPGFEPNNLDIYLSTYDDNPFPFQDLFHNYLKLWGWTTNDFGNITYPDNTLKIALRQCFIHPLHTKTVNLYFIEADDLVDYIKTSFDLSCAATWWNEDEGRFETYDPEVTRRRQLYLGNKLYMVSENELAERYIRYTDYGFTYADHECPYHEEPDLRTTLDDKNYPLRGTMAFDLFAYEDVDACEFLKQSSWNILIKAGETFYAYDRRMLLEYMKTKVCTLPLLYNVYDTPNHQSITQDGFNALNCADYSIFELQHEYSTPTPSQKSIYTLHCYKVTQWPTGDPNKSHFPPLYEVDASVLDIVRNQLADELGEEQYDNNINMINYALDVIENMQEYFHVQH